jgi:hypothetical protein
MNLLNRDFINNDIIIECCDVLYNKEHLIKFIDILKYEFKLIGIKKSSTISINGRYNNDIYFFSSFICNI